MATFTIEQDKSVRLHLADLRNAMARKFSNTTYQGQYVNTVTGKTFGDRVQTGTQRTIGDNRYLFVLNVQVLRNTGGRVAVRVGAFSLDSGRMVGTWAVGRTALGADKKRPSNGVFLTGAGFERRISGKRVPTTAQGIAERAYPFMEQAIATIEASLKGDRVSAGRPVQLVHYYGPNHPLAGEPYDTDEEHLLPFGGIAQAKARLLK